MFLFRAIVLTLADRGEAEDIPVKFETIFRVPHDNGGMINAEEELLRGTMPFRIAFVRGKLQDFERVSIRIFEVKGLNARCLSGASGKSMLLLATLRCQIFDVADAGDDAPIYKDADGCSSTLSPPRPL